MPDRLSRLVTHIGLPTTPADYGAVLIAGLITAMITLISCISFATLIYSGPLAPFASRGIQMAVATVMVAGTIIALGSSSNRVIAMPDDDTAPILALLAALTVAALPVDMPLEVKFIVATAAILCCAITTGIGLAVFGALRLGAFVRYLPYSVMGGYFAGVGWLLVVGAMQVTTNLEFDNWSDCNALLNPEIVARWAPAVLSAVLIGLSNSKVQQSLAMPAGVIGSILIFYLGAALFGLDRAALMRDGWLLGPIPEANGPLLNPLLITEFNQISWSAILGQSNTIATIMMLSMISLLLTVSGLGLRTGDDLNLNRELSVSGVANMISGLSGGWIGLPSTTVSNIPINVGAPPTRLVALSVVVFCALTLMFGMQLVAQFPKPVLAGLLMFLGVEFLMTWIVQSRSKFPQLEYLVIVSILLVITFAGFMEGVLFGLFAAVILFVINYSQTAVVRYELTGGQQKSNVERNPEEQRFLMEHGEKTQVLKLQGYLFFGTASRLESQIQQRTRDNAREALRFAVLDFAQVSGIDSSAALSFLKMGQEAARYSFFLVLTGLRPELRQRLEQSGFTSSLSSFIRFETDLDRGIEWCEEQILSEQKETLEPESFLNQIRKFLPSDEDAETFRNYLTLRQVKAGEVLATQGEDSDVMFLIESSAASVYLGIKEGERHRIRRTYSGTVFGELGFYLGTPRSATVIADIDGEIFELSQEALTRMEKECPQVAAGFHEFMVNVLAGRLLNTTQTLAAVLK